MISNKPYLLRAFYQWIVDSNCTPILVIDAHYPHSTIPHEHAEGGEIVFNVSPTAVRELNIANDNIDFRASFSGLVNLISVPVKAILALYAEENGEGVFFDADEENDAEPIVELKGIEGTGGHISNTEPAAAGSENKAKPFLRLVEKTVE